MMASESCAMCGTHRVPSSVLTLDTFILKNIKEFSKHIIYFAKEVTNTKEVLLYIHVDM